MKKFNVILVGICMVLMAFVACKTIETNVVKESTEGEYKFVDVDPAVIISEWEYIITVPWDQPFIEIYYQNPDNNFPIQFATVIGLMNQFGQLVGFPGYSYMVGGKINFCRFNEETNIYESVWDTFDEESKRRWYKDYNTYFGLIES